MFVPPYIYMGMCMYVCMCVCMTNVCIINPWRTCTAKVTVVVLCVCLCLSVCLSVRTRYSGSTHN